VSEAAFVFMTILFNVSDEEIIHALTWSVLYMVYNINSASFTSSSVVQQ
jgi:membrane protein CcdC involved in cytochrome C biogenesis